jgi:peroxiredoxin
VFLGVAWSGTSDAMLDFIDRHGISFPTIVDQSGDIYLRYQVPYQPAWVFIDADGNHRRVMGSLGETELLENIQTIT